MIVYYFSYLSIKVINIIRLEPLWLMPYASKLQPNWTRWHSFLSVGCVAAAAAASLSAAQPMLTHRLDSETLAADSHSPEPIVGRSWRELVGTGLLLGTVHVLSGPDHLSALLTLSGVHISDSTVHIFCHELFASSKTTTFFPW